jgi:hypothetical protein
MVANLLCDASKGQLSDASELVTGSIRDEVAIASKMDRHKHSRVRQEKIVARHLRDENSDAELSAAIVCLFQPCRHRAGVYRLVFTLCATHYAGHASVDVSSPSCCQVRGLRSLSLGAGRAHSR